MRALLRVFLVRETTSKAAIHDRIGPLFLPGVPTTFHEGHEDFHPVANINIPLLMYVCVYVCKLEIEGKIVK